MTEKFKSPICEHCTQTTQYALAVDRGTVDILKAISVRIKIKGVNEVHPRKEMEYGGRETINYKDMVTLGVITSNQVGNLSRARFHGLIARVKERPGTYCMTDKGERFLTGEAIPKFAIIDKTTKSQVGYWNSNRIGPPWWVTIRDFKPDQEYWEGWENYRIYAGKVVSREANQPALV